MKGIKPYTHKAREDILTQLIPELKHFFGEDLLAAGVAGSFVHNNDKAYSDLELVVFVEENSSKANWNYHKIIDGLLIVIVAETEKGYIEKYLDVSEVWYASGDSPLLPIINDSFINNINNYQPKDVEEKAWKQAVKRWHLVQETTAKVLNNAQKKNHEGMPIVFFTMIKELLIILSFINQTPYKTLEKYAEQAKQFTIKPKSFDELLEILNNGKYQNFALVEKTVTEVFTDLEQLFEKHGYSLYAGLPNLA